MIKARRQSPLLRVSEDYARELLQVMHDTITQNDGSPMPVFSADGLEQLPAWAIAQPYTASADSKKNAAADTERTRFEQARSDAWKQYNALQKKGAEEKATNKNLSLKDRFEQWWDISEDEAAEVVKSNRQNLLEAAEEFGVDPNIVALVIYTEQADNVNKRDTFTDWLAVGGVDTSVGIGQVKLSTAQDIEQSGYIEPIIDPQESFNYFSQPDLDSDFANHLRENVTTTKTLSDNKTNARYVAAYLKMIQDAWESEYPAISKDLAIMATLYNIGIGVPHANPKPNPFGENAKSYFYLMPDLLKH